MTTDIIYAVGAAAVTAAAAFVYRAVWRARAGSERTPTGFGVFLPFVLLGAAVAAGAPAVLHIPLAVVGIGTLAYWLDDIVELRARMRILISLVTGAAVAVAAILAGAATLSPLAAAGLCAAAALVSVVLTNLVNFYDGADLNLATYIALTAGILLFYGPAGSIWLPIAIASLAFILPFAAFNSRPRTLYLGDAGSFAFAGLLTVMGVIFLIDPSSLPPEAAIPSALPALDVAYVFAVRVAERHDLLTRNWLHLYQRLNARYSGFGYLLPQFVNAGLCVLASISFQAGGMDRLPAVIAAMIVVTIPFYFACRWAFVPAGEAGQAGSNP